MRKLFAIAAIVCLLLLMGGYHLMYQVRLAEAKRDMRSQLLNVNKELLSRFVFSADEAASLAWDGDSEFRYNGEMYDVLQLEEKDGTTIIWCLADKKETALLEQYQRSQKQSTGTSSVLLLKILSAQYLPCSLTLLSAIEQARPNRIAFLPPSVSLVAGKVITPPPRVC